MHSEYPLSPAQVQSFQDNGYIYLRQLADSNDAEAYRQSISAAVNRLNTESRAMHERDTYGKAFLQIMNIWLKDDAVRKFSLSERFAKVAAKLLGVEKVRMYHDQALYKEPGGGPTPWHQDQYYWPLDTTNTVTLWMPLVDIDESMGILTFAEGSHKDGLVKNLAISDESEQLLDQHVANKGYRVWRPESMQAGDVTFHYGYTLHKAPGNSSGKMREVMTVIYYADGARVTTPVNDAQEKDRQTWFLGLEPGVPAASAINPVIG